MEIQSSVENLFNQLRFILDEVNDRQFITPSVSLSGATIGQHIRHSIEFFTCLLDGMESGTVNYDKRRREKPLEESTSSAIKTLNQCASQLQKINGSQHIVLELSYSHVKNDPLRVDSNFNRELVYNIEHAIHHMALIKIGMREVAPSVVLPGGFGVANSTIRHTKQQEKVSE